MTENKPKRQYPPFYEKFVPVAIGTLGLIVIAMLLFTLAVGIGWINFI
jgi:hypothetical protein